MPKLPLWTFNRQSAQIRFQQREKEATLALPGNVYQAIASATSVLQHVWKNDLKRIGEIPEHVLRDVAQAMAAVNLEINDRLYQGRSLDDEHIGVERLEKILSSEALLVLAVLYGVHGGWSNPIVYNEAETSVTVLDLYTDDPLDEKSMDRYRTDLSPVEEVQQMLAQIPEFFALRRRYHPNLKYFPYTQ